MLHISLTLFFAILDILGESYAGLDPTSSSNVAVYWGQNSVGQYASPLTQQGLSYYCQNPNIDVFQLAFLTVVNGVGGAPEINFANSNSRCSTFHGTGLIDCPEIGVAIKTCQSLGKTILLSIGGTTYSEGGFNTDAAAAESAKLIWQTFGPVSSNTSVHRPFGDAVIDGFDFDFESEVKNMPTFANELRSYFAHDPYKKYYLTAAPQCSYPDAADGPMLDGTVHFDAIWVQFYNNDCGLQSYALGRSGQNNFNFDTWDNWAHTTSLNKNVKVFVGVPGSGTAAESGYEPVSNLEPIIEYVQGFKSFGGVMIWDASQAKANNGFISGVKSALAKPPPSYRHHHGHCRNRHHR